MSQSDAAASHPPVSQCLSSHHEWLLPSGFPFNAYASKGFGRAHWNFALSVNKPRIPNLESRLQ